MKTMRKSRAQYIMTGTAVTLAPQIFFSFAQPLLDEKEVSLKATMIRSC
jgi:hypothetical protein